MLVLLGESPASPRHETTRRTTRRNVRAAIWWPTLDDGAPFHYVVRPNGADHQ